MKEEKKLTPAQIRTIEHILKNGYRVEIIPVKDGARIIRLDRKEIKPE